MTNYVTPADAIVRHYTLGYGKIKKLEYDDKLNRKYITILFDDCSEPKMFHYPEEFITGLLSATDEDTKIVVSYEIDKFNNKKASDNYNEIRKIIMDREIRYLHHFTQAENLPSILEHGLVPINKHNEKSINAVVNDKKRYDGGVHTNLSVSQLNYYLLQQFILNRDDNTDWVVINVDSSILLSTDNQATYCQTNAANRSGEKGCSASDFQSMFSETVKYKTDAKGKIVIPRQPGLPKHLTTDIQAEITISGIIPPKYIKGVIFQSNGVMDKALKEYGLKKDKRFVVDSNIFEKDYVIPFYR